MSARATASGGPDPDGFGTARPVALVTGASRGIGRATAVRLAATHDVVAVARPVVDLDALAEEIGRGGGRCRPVVLDLADGDAIAPTLAAALDGLAVDVVVNNAGIGVLRPMLELSADDWRRMVAVNFDALFHVTRAVLPGMLARERGHVVVIGSIAGRPPGSRTCSAR